MTTSWCPVFFYRVAATLSRTPSKALSSASSSLYCLFSLYVYGIWADFVLYSRDLHCFMPLSPAPPVPAPSVALWSISGTSSAALLPTLEAQPLLVPLLFLFARETLTILGKRIELLFKWKQLSSSMHFICGLWQVHRHYAGDSVDNSCLFSGFLAPTRISRVLLNESWSTPWNFQMDEG